MGPAELGFEMSTIMRKLPVSAPLSPSPDASEWTRKPPSVASQTCDRTEDAPDGLAALVVGGRDAVLGLATGTREVISKAREVQAEDLLGPERGEALDEQVGLGSGDGDPRIRRAIPGPGRGADDQDPGRARDRVAGVVLIHEQRARLVRAIDHDPRHHGPTLGFHARGRLGLRDLDLEFVRIEGVEGTRRGAEREGPIGHAIARHRCRRA